MMLAKAQLENGLVFLSLLQSQSIPMKMSLQDDLEEITELFEKHIERVVWLEREAAFCLQLQLWVEARIKALQLDYNGMNRAKPQQPEQQLFLVPTALYRALWKRV